jgi:small multidrug resistance pump
MLLRNLAEVIATAALKSSEGITKIIPSVIVILGYGIAFFLSFIDIKGRHSYAIWSGVGIALISIISYFFYKQILDIPAILGI